MTNTIGQCRISGDFHTPFILLQLGYVAEILLPGPQLHHAHERTLVGTGNDLRRVLRVEALAVERIDHDFGTENMAYDFLILGFESSDQKA